MVISPELQRRLSELSLPELERLTAISRQQLCETFGNRGITDTNLFFSEACTVFAKREPQLDVLPGLLDQA